MSRPQAILIGLLLCLGAAPARAGWLARCLVGLGKFLASDTSSDIALTAEEKRDLAQWQAKYAMPGYAQADAFTPEQMLLALAELPAPLRHKLFAAGITPWAELPRQIRARFLAVGLDPESHPVLGFAYGRIRRDSLPGNDPQGALEDAIAEVKRLPPEKQQALERERQLRRDVYLAIQALSNSENPQYDLRFEGGTVILPDGMRYPYTRTTLGKLKIAIPYRDLIQHQSYENSQIVGSYQSTPWNGWGGLDGGFLTPDGRYVMVDAFHRAKAYALAHTPPGGKMEDTPVPVLVTPDSHGRFFTATHYSVMTTALLFPRTDGIPRWSDRTWGFLSPEQRARILETAKTDPAGAIRDWYYESTGLARP